MKAKRLIALLIAVFVLLLTACTKRVPAFDIIEISPVPVPTDSAVPATPDAGHTPAEPNTPDPTTTAAEPLSPEPTPTAEPTAVTTPAPTPAPTPVPTPAPTPAPTPKPTATPTPMLYPTFDPEHPREQDGSRVIYLTFDDGPCAGTLQVLDILDSFGIKATFFTVGYFVDRHPNIAAETVRRGNLIACHTYTHDMAQVYASPEAFMNEVHRWESAVINACGGLPRRVCVRFPGGSSTAAARPVKEAIVSLLTAGGYRWFDWNAGDNDKWPAGNVHHLPNREYLMQSYLQSINWFESRPGTPVIFLSHDTEPDTVAVLPDIIRDLINRGYVFKTLDQHPGWNQ